MGVFKAVRHHLNSTDRNKPERKWLKDLQSRYPGEFLSSGKWTNISKLYTVRCDTLVHVNSVKPLPDFMSITKDCDNGILEVQATVASLGPAKPEGAMSKEEKDVTLASIRILGYVCSVKINLHVCIAVQNLCKTLFSIDL